MVVERGLCRLGCVSVVGGCRTMRGVLGPWLWLRWLLLSGERGRGGEKLVGHWSLPVTIYDTVLVVSFG